VAARTTGAPDGVAVRHHRRPTDGLVARTTGAPDDAVVANTSTGA